MTNVISIVKAHLAGHPLVVISAIAKATNELELTARTAAAGKEDQAVSIVTSAPPTKSIYNNGAQCSFQQADILIFCANILLERHQIVREAQRHYRQPDQRTRNGD